MSLENRTPEQIVEEEALYIEIKRLEQNERQFKKDRDELLRTIAGIDSGLPDIIEDEGIPNLSIDVKKKKKGASAMDIDSPSTPAPPPPVPVVKRPQTAKSAAYGINSRSILHPYIDSLVYRYRQLYHPHRPTHHRSCYQSCTSTSLPPIFQASCAKSCYCP